MPKKRICLLGGFKRRDDGYANIDYYLSRELSNKFDVLLLVTKEIFGIRFWKVLRDFRPDIIHSLRGPTFKSILALGIIKIYCIAKTVISAIHPCLNLRCRFLAKVFKPDLILVQSCEIDGIFKNLGCRTEFLTNGVDVEKFSPVGDEIKKELRRKFDLSPDIFIILHVGHLIKARNLGILASIQKNGDQVVIAASGYFEKDPMVYNSLKQRGCLIWDKYFENIEELYAMADCYVFPVKKGDTIQTPLSVMEAMACNIPVITTKFEGLERIFEEGDGLYFAESEEDFLRKLKMIRENRPVIKNREKVLPYSWKRIADKLEEIYAKL